MVTDLQVVQWTYPRNLWNCGTGAAATGTAAWAWTAGPLWTIALKPLIGSAV